MAYDWVHQAAIILDNETGQDAQTVQQTLSRLLNEMEHQKAQVGELAEAIAHFLKVTRSYWSGLFHCYEVEGLPRTNNDLEHVFGQLRHHQRRVTGRICCPSIIGSTRVCPTHRSGCNSDSNIYRCRIRRDFIGKLAECAFPIAATSF